ncbi:DEAD/DEAH box helicase [Abyssicoccus albus]|uniref:DEAD/DEAH box helicase n=1 Tax=Abyssicoccus albus TaxID=1817405 RepID=UPI00097E2B65|nr:DEAD/DEAH box helicase [Abyssicoccus albus]AQL56070.1 DEAD/DEAH box helicase [Abyssicoccus albus]
MTNEKHSFEHLGLNESLLNAITDLNFKKPTEIQQRVIPKVLANKNLVAQSQTGTGKSHSYLLPIIEKVDAHSTDVEAIILTPTRELARQVFDMTNHLIRFDKDVTAGIYIGGTDFLKDANKKIPNIVIGTPTRIKELNREGKLNINVANTIVLDEADLMIDLGFMEDVDQLVSHVKKDAQLLVFSATIPKGLHPFLNKYISNPEFVEIEPQSKTSKNIEHLLIPTRSMSKEDKLIEITKTINPYLAILFANSREACDEYYQYLLNAGVNVGIIHGGLSPRERKQQITKIKNLDYVYVVASDLASRGLDFDGVSHVINIDIPNDLEFFVHRVGRTGRGDYKGVAITMYTPDDERAIDLIEERGIKFNHVDIMKGEIKPIKPRTERKNRAKNQMTIDKNLKHKVKSSKKVKPGYKKKFKRKLDDLKKQEMKRYGKVQKRKK